jgi:hypothetical protein
MNKPDYLIIGTMKGGTTILQDFICDHPDVAEPEEKEIHYFSLFYNKGEDWYSNKFLSRSENQIIGEASPTYFDMADGGVIPRLIDNDLPDVKLLLMVRDPVERAVSHYNHYCKVNKLERIEEMGIERFFNQSYSEALRCSNEQEMHLYHVLNFSCYQNKYAIYRQIFKDRLLVVTNDQLRSDPGNTMDRVHAHLGLSPRESELFQQVRYSTGTSTNQLSEETAQKLRDFLYPGYRKFCGDAQIQFAEAA